MSDQQQAFLVKANGFVFTLTESDMAQADIVAEANHVYHLIYQHQSVNGKVLDAAADHKTMQVEVHGNTYDVNIKDSLDQMLDSMGYSAAGSKHIKEVKAPMPGLVLSVSVEAGQQVQEGDRLLILEAMKNGKQHHDTCCSHHQISIGKSRTSRRQRAGSRSARITFLSLTQKHFACEKYL
jgi:Acetyl/propionyl-CoA carboxylase, alpha subunit